MNIIAYLNEYEKKNNYSYRYNTKMAKNLLFGDNAFAFKQQSGFADSESLACNIKASVRAYTADKDNAILIYKDLLAFLASKGVFVEIEFPPISISSKFERLMFIAKYLQTPGSKVSKLQDILWVSRETIKADLKTLRGEDEKTRLQVCGKAFKVDYKRKYDEVDFPSTAHPLFLTPNIPQILATLKGLKALSNDPLYENYARTFAADIWEQLSDYAKKRIHIVFSEILPEDLSWYESLQKEPYDEDEEGGDWFYSEQRCSVRNNVLMEAFKNEKAFHVIYQDADKQYVYGNCLIINKTYDGKSFEVNCSQGRVRLFFDRIIRSAYTAEELI